MALRVNAAAAGKLHDRGHTADPNADISVHYRSGGHYARGGGGSYSSHMNGGSLRGGSVRGMKDPDSSSRGGMRRFTSLRGSRSGVELSSMDQDGFRRRTTSNVTADLSGSGSGRSREGPQASKGTLLLQLLLVGMKRHLPKGPRDHIKASMSGATAACCCLSPQLQPDAALCSMLQVDKIWW